MMACTSVHLASDTVVQAEMGVLTNKMLNLQVLNERTCVVTFQLWSQKQTKTKI